MHRHPNAVLTPRGRARVFEAVEAGMTVSAACLGAGISRRRYYRWLPRWRAQGRAGLVERVSRPHHSPRRLSLEQGIRIIAVRLLLGWGPDRIAAIVGLPASSCHRVLRRGGLVHTKAAPVNRTGFRGDPDDRSQAAGATCWSAQYAASYSAGGMSPQAPWSRCEFHQWTQAAVSDSTCSTDRQGPARSMSSAS